jgi:hypothetical protein
LKSLFKKIHHRGPREKLTESAEKKKQLYFFLRDLCELFSGASVVEAPGYGCAALYYCLRISSQPAKIWLWNLESGILDAAVSRRCASAVNCT